MTTGVNKNKSEESNLLSFFAYAYLRNLQFVHNLFEITLDKWQEIC